MSRARIRLGRAARYFPTAAEAALYGTGPYLARIARVATNGTVDLVVDAPAAVAEAGTVDGTWGASPEGDLLDELRARENFRFKTGVLKGGKPGQYAFNGLFA